MPSDHNTYEDFKSGYVAIVGAPNAGKSTLLNRLLGEKISITSKKPQTTRNRILGVLHRPDTQIVFLDTPGIFKAKDTLNLRIVDTALAAIDEADLILFVLDAAHPDLTSEYFLAKRLQKQQRPVIVALNKIDQIQKTDLLAIIKKWSTEYYFEVIIPISATEGTQIEPLITAMQNMLPSGPPYFPEDALTDLSERFVAAEMIRETVFRLTGEEIPYATAVTVDTFKEEKKGKLIRIEATIHLERASQKGIIIGKEGNKLKRIGIDSRKKIEQMLETKVFLKLFVRVQKNWRKDTRALRKFGY
ncbi:MAG: GTPase Era [Desulfobacterales bacterium]|nr:GTPase Era [Desulfobacterales bacterium]